MIYGIGIDIIEINRIEELIEKMADKFLNRVFTPEEREYCDKMARRASHYAVRFAAKEAFLKALSTGLTSGIRWKDICVINEPSGKPILKITGRALEIMNEHGITHSHISLSHSRTLATSIVTLEI